MTSQQLYTYKDAVDHALQYLGADATAQGRQDAKLAARQALMNLTKAHRWSFYLGRGRIHANAPYRTGTAAYDHTGGTYERSLTLADGTWPDWAAYANVVLGDIVYEVAERISDAVVTLTAGNNPGADVAAATYTLFRDTYVLPADFLGCDRMLNVTNAGYLYYGHPREWLERQRITFLTSQPVIWTLTGDPNYSGLMAARFYPPPDMAYQFDFLYQRQPRPLAVEEYKDGTVSASQGAAAVTGSGTAFGGKHVGAVIRFGDATNTPTGMVGAYPYAQERVVMSVESATSLTVDAVLPDALSGVKYTISDPVDIESAVMLTAYQAGIEKELARRKRMKDRDQADAVYREELLMAQQADARSFEQRSSGAHPAYLPRFANMPTGPDIT
jgi:hypothetical protein